MPDIGWQVGIDIGGTFTDLVALHARRPAKSARSRSRPSATIRSPASRRRSPPPACTSEDVDDLMHGTTLVTNAIVEDRVEPVALIATQGFEDVLDIGRAGRQHLYRLDLPPRRVGPGAGRSAASAWPSASTTPAQAMPARPTPPRSPRRSQRARATGVESVAVSLLHAYANPAHERALGAALAAALPFVSLSHEVNPETREFERTATTVLNASVMPIAARYLDRLQREVAGRAPACHAFGRRHGLAGSRRPTAARHGAVGPGRRRFRRRRMSRPRSASTRC